MSLEFKPIPELFEAQVARNPAAPALTMGGESISYAELNRRANRLAHLLKELGVSAGSIVAMSMDRSFDMVTALLAILKAGGAYLPFDYELPEERIKTMLDDANVGILLTHSSITVGGIDGVETVIAVDRLNDAAGEADRNLPVQPAPESVAYINYTSGSSGAPKGVVIPHRAVASLLSGPTYATLDETSRVLQLAPASFDALTFELWGPLLHGGCCVLFDGKFPTVSKLKKTIRENGVTIVFLTTALFNLVIDEMPDTLETVKELLTGGEAHSVGHMRRAMELLPGTRISSVYGPTEATTFATHFPLAGLSECAATVPLGKEINHRKVFILDADRNLCRTGETGEICIAGPGLAIGYLGKPELTAERFITGLPFLKPGDRAYKTGDLGRYADDGTIEFLGRADSQIKLNGFRIELGEIETVLRSHEDIRQAVVVPYEKAGEKRLAAVLVTSDDTLPELSPFLRRKLPSYMIPAQYLSVDALPITPNGKIDRRRVSSMCAERFGDLVS